VYALEVDGFEVCWRNRGADGLAELGQGGIDLVILDVGLPDSSGFEVCRQLRKFSEVPVMFLTARGEEIDRVVGLEIGADDYVVKPFSPREVVARVRAILKRARPAAASPAVEKSGDSLFEVDESRMRILFHNQPLVLTPHEFRLLAHLLRQPDVVFSREQLLQAIGVAAEAGYDRVIDGHIKTLRAKLRAIDENLNPIQTHRGFGYSICLEPC
jgi:two-component system, OmpR family, catabolic regulation response regulator CreB